MMHELHRIVGVIDSGWSGKNVVVLGDVMLDRYVWGDVERISPEAPVPVVRVMHESDQPGGAGNVAMNIAALGGRASVFGFCGDDADSYSLENHLRAGGVESCLVRVPGHPTTAKLRIVGGKQQMLRLDKERIGQYPEAAAQELRSNVAAAIKDADAVVLSDYAKGVLTEETCRVAIDAARSRGIPVLVDPKHRSFARYRGATTVCPNLGELSAAVGVSPLAVDEMLAAGQRLARELDLEYLTATMSEKGIAILRPDSRFMAPAVARQVFDVSGAGDTVIATLALALAAGLQIEPAVQLANAAAGVAVSKVGTVPVRREELLLSIMPEIEHQTAEKILPLDKLGARVTAWRQAGQRIIFTNGCFDLLHVGHITLLEDARREGDRLVVAINSDRSVRELKGKSRPIVGEMERAQMLAALAAVDAVVVFDEATPLNAIQALRPDVIVKGGDYNPDTIVGANEVRAWGGTVKIVPTVEGFSTTNLIAKALSPAAAE